MEDHASKKAVIYQAFKERLGKSRDFQMKFYFQNINKMVDNPDQLTIPFTKEQLDTVIHEMHIDRAPGLDGFTRVFLKKCWHINKEDFYELCNLSLMAILIWRTSMRDSSC